MFDEYRTNLGFKKLGPGRWIGRRPRTARAEGEQDKKGQGNFHRVHYSHISGVWEMTIYPVTRRVSEGLLLVTRRVSEGSCWSLAYASGYHHFLSWPSTT